jgi:hypothetical protein
VLLDFTCGRDNPAIPYVGAAIREECALEDNMRTISDVPSRSLLSRLTDHYMQIIANRAPVGFEAEFENPYAESSCYRGSLMPFSSDGDAIDFIYGVINWKRLDTPTAAAPVCGLGDQAASVEIAGIGGCDFESNRHLLRSTRMSRSNWLSQRAPKRKSHSLSWLELAGAERKSHSS